MQIPETFKSLASLTDSELASFASEHPAEFAKLLGEVADLAEQDRRERALYYYNVRNPMASPVHQSMAREIAICGGNRSSKTTTMLAEAAIQLTGIIPEALKGTYPREKLRGPIRARICCNSLVDTLEPIIKPKLRWDQWNGIGDPADGRGHWGWIPRECLKGGAWEKAYSDKYRTLTVRNTTTWGSGSETTYSTCQFLSYDQDLTAFVGTSLHLVGHDELPPQDIYRENRLRTLDVKGQIYTAFTPPDEAGAQIRDVSYFFDEVYERGLAGPKKHPSVETIVLYTEANSILDAQAILDLSSRMTAAQREVRLRGAFIHLSGIVYHDFTIYDATWCFKCAKRIIPVDGHCTSCADKDIIEYCHVIPEFKVPKEWPVVFVIDPHPRKADVMGWFAVSPRDDVYMIGELEVEGTADDVAKSIRLWEEAHLVSPARRLMDPNIATETNDKLQRGWTLQRAYDEVGIRCALANDEMNTGIERVHQLLRPDPYTRRPRLAIFEDCNKTIHAMTRWSWDEWTRQSGDKEPKERVRERYKDFPDVVRYLANDRPEYNKYRQPVTPYRAPR